MSKDQTRFRDLYERYANDLFRFAFWLSGDSDTAKDITAETFVRVWTADSEPRMESVKAYLFAIARNLYLQQYRRTKRFSVMTGEIEDRSDHTERRVEDRSALEHLLSVLRTFPEIDRTVLLMRAYEELSYKDIAEATGLSPAAVKVRVFRARAKLATQMSHLGENTP